MRVKKEQKLRKKRLVKHKNPKVLKKIALALAIVLVATVTYVHFLQPHTLEVKQRLQLESTQQQLTKTRNNLQKTQAQSVQDEKAKQDEINKLNQQLKDTQDQLQAKAASKATAVAYAAPAPTYSLPTDAAKAYIYDHESGNNPGAINAGSGACGLGQALPCSKMGCGLADYACQDAYFDNYAIQRYGSWSAAAAFWQVHRWW